MLEDVVRSIAEDEQQALDEPSNAVSYVSPNSTPEGFLPEPRSRPWTFK